MALFPSIAKMVDIDTYNTLDDRKYPKPYVPWEISAYSHTPLPFSCDFCGEVHFKPVAQMVNQSTGCPHLCARNHDSMPQLILYKLMKKVIPDLKYKHIFILNGKKCELDLYSSSLRVAVEYDGYKHDDKRLRFDYEKSECCLRNGILLIRVREDSAADLDESLGAVITCRYDNKYKYLVDVMVQMSAILQESFQIKSRFDYSDIVSAWQNAVPVRVLKDSFIRTYPIFSRLLHPNDSVRATRIRPKSSSMKLKCTCLRCNHNFSKTPKKLVEQKGRCPKCGWFFKNMTDKNSPLEPPLKNWAPRKIGGKLYGSIN
jgi:very-short-patch-repair endonuclease